MRQGDKLLKRLEQIQKADGKPVLVSMMILVGEEGEPAYWFVDNYIRAEG